MRTCISPNGQFLFTIHEPCYKVRNLRLHDAVESLGFCQEKAYLNRQNFPQGDINVETADRIYEIPNAFPFRGSTFINSRWADPRAGNPLTIKLSQPQKISMTQSIMTWQDADTDRLDEIFSKLPDTVLLALATTSTDPEDLVRLARLSCVFTLDKTGQPTGLTYQANSDGEIRAKINNHPLFEAVGNNLFLPDKYKQAMVLRPGAQGGSEIIGEWHEEEHHVFEYLRRNSYIPWGHFASNMANDAVRYTIKDLSLQDMQGLRHLYYQRTYVRLAEQFQIKLPSTNKPLSAAELEILRQKIMHQLHEKSIAADFDSTMWGWNYGFDFAPSKYRLNASHQQIHQQFAMLPATLPLWQQGEKTSETFTPFACGDLVAECVDNYYQKYARSFFDDLISNIRNNKRLDTRSGKSSLIVYEDPNVILFVPKAQTSQWELQLMTVESVGNIFEANQSVRTSLDKGIHTAMQILGSLGIRMVTTIEYSKRLNKQIDQRLLYCFLPKLPESPGAFSEAQLRWITGHFPEDFAIACRNCLNKI